MPHDVRLTADDDCFCSSFPGQREEVLMPYLRTLSSFRDGVRKLAIAKGDGALKDILALSDKLRDTDLVPLGVALDDQEGAWLVRRGWLRE